MWVPKVYISLFLLWRLNLRIHQRPSQHHDEKEEHMHTIP